MNNTIKKAVWILSAILLSVTLLGCQAKEVSDGTKQLNDKASTQKKEKKEDVNEKKMTFEKLSEDSNLLARTTLTFKNEKLVEEETQYDIPYAQSEPKMKKEEFVELINDNKISLANETGVHYDGKVISDSVGRISFSIDFTKADVEKFGWLTSNTSQTSMLEAVSNLEKNDFKQAK